MTKTKNFPHRKLARRERARLQVVRRLQAADREVERAKKEPNELDRVKATERAEFHVTRLSIELKQLDQNIKENLTGKQRRKLDRKQARRHSLAF